MTGSGQVPEVGLDLDILLKQIQRGTEAEEFIKIVERVMVDYRDAVFTEMCKKLTADKLHNFNSVCVALNMIHSSLQNMITNKKVAEDEIKTREED